MSLWKHLFDSELRQREDIDFLQANASVNRATNDRLTADSRELEQIVERQALLLETLYRVVVDGGLITKEGFKELVTQVDLEDGIEDGTVGRDRTANAPKCTNCEKPVNPRRDFCVYCHAEVPEELKRKRKRRGSAYRR